ncbi:MAG: F0F1 ATP synthase subunit A [Pirellulales bacterium]|nr:F0F1 ATP synthase subunit A [Pirellulales bacterium]
MAADPLLHIKDSYYFEVPRFLWQYTNINQIPQWLRDSHADDHFTLADYQEHLNGKIIIPQFFGTPKNLYEPGTGFSVSKFMIIMLVVALIMIFLFTRLALHIRSEGAPRGRLWNLLETFVVFLRDQVIRPAIDGGHDDHGHGDHAADGHVHDDPRHAELVPATAGHGHGAVAAGHAVGGHAAHAHHARESDKFLPYLLTLFFFVLGCNLFGILPWLGSPTGMFTVTLVLAGCTMLAGLIGGIMKFGPLGYLTNLVPGMDLPIYMAVILKPFIFVIEVFGLLVKHGILAVRLLANMVAGHLVIGGIMGLIVAAAASSSAFSYWLTVVIVCFGSMAFFLLELFVAFLQAYIFTFLSSLFIGASIHKH